MKTQSHWKQKVPWAMVISRAALGPVMVLLSYYSHRQILLAACVVAAFVLDIFDGILARLWQVQTGFLRRCDTLADTIFYSAAILVVLLHYPASAQRIWPALVLLVVLELIQHMFSILKFGRLASYHSRLSKVWGVLLAVALIALLGFGWDKMLPLAIAWGILCNLEGFAMSFVLPAWHHDVPTLGYAIWMRRELEYQARSQRKPKVIGI